MRLDRCLLHVASLLTLVALLLPGAANAQSSGDQATPKNAAPGSEAAEKQFGEYTVSQSVEFGFRFTDVRGPTYACTSSSSGRCQDQSMYNTLVNLNTGPRLLEQTLSMRAPAGKGGLFDDLYLSTFGFGGDPNNLARLRLKKSRVYNLNVLFRRDQNFFNYDLLANPLNPGIINTTVSPLFSPRNISLFPGVAPATFLLGNSPHYFANVRRMTDVDLAIAPQSVIGLRLGYSRVRVEGPFGSSFHVPMGTDINPIDNSNNTTDMYRAGLDFRFVPKTTISVDGFYTHNRVDLSGTDPNLFFTTTGGLLTDLGVSWNAAGRQPCAAPFIGGIANPACNQAVFYQLAHNYRTSTPTGQVSFQSHPSRWFDLSGRAMYTHSHMDGSYLHQWTGVAGTGNRQVVTSLMANRRTEGSADLGLTIHLTEKVRILDEFRWYNWRDPSLAIENAITQNPGSHPITTPLAAPVPGSLAWCPSPGLCGIARFHKQDSRQNQVELEYDFTKAVGARVGYRFERRLTIASDETVALTGTADEPTFPAPGDVESGVDNLEQPIHTGIFGLWVRPNEKFRASFDAEASSLGARIGGPVTVFGLTSNAYDLTALTSNAGLGEMTRITPRHEQQYRFRANYNPQRWMTVGATVNVLEQNNHQSDIAYDMHNHNAGANITLMPNDKYAFDLSYNYNNYMQGNLICPIQTATTTAPFITGSTVLSLVCPFDISESTGLPTGLFQTFGNFESVNHFASALVRAKVIPRVTVSLGYSISSNNGAQVYTNPLLVPGSLKNSFHRPLADLELEIVRHFFVKGGWNYYGYNEKGPAGPALPRDFHANSAMLSLKYAF